MWKTDEYIANGPRLLSTSRSIQYKDDGYDGYVGDVSRIPRRLIYLIMRKEAKLAQQRIKKISINIYGGTIYSIIIRYMLLAAGTAKQCYYSSDSYPRQQELITTLFCFLFSTVALSLV